MANKKWNSFPHLTGAQLADDDQLPVSDSSQPDGEKDATTTIGALRDAISGGGGPVAAEDVTYDNGTSGLTAEDVQNAIDEVYAAVVAGGIPAASGIVIARHGDDPDFPDPNTGGVTYWLGSAAPNNRKVGDLWLETDTFDGGS